MALQAHRAALLRRNILSLDTLTFLRAASTNPTFGTWPYNTPNKTVPPLYPYGEAGYYRRRDSGLFGSAAIQHGHSVSRKSKTKILRIWKPNVRNKKLWSNYLGRFVQVKIVARVLKTIDKLGGLDEYLVGNTSPIRIKELGVTGWNLRWRMMQTRGYKERVARERRELGLPEKGWVFEEKQRKTRERREGMRIAEAFLVASEATMKPGSRAVPEIIQNEDDRVSRYFMSEDETSAVKQRNKQRLNEYTDEAKGKDMERADVSMREAEAAQNSFEIESNPGEELVEFDDSVQNGIVEPDAELSESGMLGFPATSDKDQLFIQLTAIAAQLGTTPSELLDQTSIMIENRTNQLALVADRRAQLAAEQADLASEIDTLLASSEVEPILEFYNKHTATAHSEAALQREHEGRSRLSPTQLKHAVIGPPSNISADKWAELRARMKIIKKGEPERLQEKAKREEHKAARSRFLRTNVGTVLAESKARREKLGFFRKVLYQLRWVRRSGLMARFRRNRYAEKKTVGTRAEGIFGSEGRLRTLFRRRKPESEQEGVNKDYKS